MNNRKKQISAVALALFLGTAGVLTTSIPSCALTADSLTRDDRFNSEGEAGKGLTYANYVVKKGIAIYDECLLDDDETKAKIAASVRLEGKYFPVRFVGSFAFDGYEELKTVEIPSSIVGIKKKAFSGAPNLYKITVKSKRLNKASVQGAFLNSEVRIVVVPKSKYAAYTKIFTKRNTGALYDIEVRKQ